MFYVVATIIRKYNQTLQGITENASLKQTGISVCLTNPVRTVGLQINWPRPEVYQLAANLSVVSSLLACPVHSSHIF